MKETLKARIKELEEELKDCQLALEKISKYDHLIGRYLLFPNYRLRIKIEGACESSQYMGRTMLVGPAISCKPGCSPTIYQNFTFHVDLRETYIVEDENIWNDKLNDILDHIKG